MYWLLQIVFEGKNGPSYRGDISLDDIKILSGSCADLILLTLGNDLALCAVSTTATTTTEATTTSTTSTISTTVSTVPSTCPCPCNNVGDPALNNITTAQLMEVVKQLKQELAVDKSELSSTKRKKISTPDERSLSKGMGVFGIVMLSGMLCLLVVADSDVLVRDMKTFLRNIGIL